MWSGSTLLRVRPSHDGNGWEVVEPGSTRALMQATDQAKAVRRARDRLVSGGTLEIVGADGQVSATQQVPGPGRRPWWYATSRPLNWIVIAALSINALLGVFVYSRPFQLDWWLALVAMLCGVLGVVFLVASRVRDRRSPPAQ